MQSLLLGKFIMTHLTDKIKGSPEEVLRAQEIEGCSISDSGYSYLQVIKTKRRVRHVR